MLTNPSGPRVLHAGVLFCKGNIGTFLQDPTAQTILFLLRTSPCSSAGAASHGRSPAVTWKGFVILIKIASSDAVGRCTTEPLILSESHQAPSSSTCFELTTPSVLWGDRESIYFISSSAIRSEFPQGSYERCQFLMRLILDIYYI